MTVVAFANVVGQARGEPIRMPGRRRRLSTIVGRHRPAGGRRFIVSVHRGAAGDGRALQPSDATVRERRDWRRTLVGPRDVVLIILVPSGGGGGGGRGGKGMLGIGLAIASIALIALAPYAAPALAGLMLGLPGAAAGTLATAIQAGMVVGGLALGAAAQASLAAKTEKQRTLYSVSGGGNLPKPGGRKPLLYGLCRTAPPLSQRDYFRYDGDTMVLVKRMTLGLGRFQVEDIKVGDAVFWTRQGGLQAPFNAVAPGADAAAATAVEILYETASAIAVGDAITAGDVAGQELPRVAGNPSVTPWFRAQPQGVTVDRLLLSYNFPTVYRTSSAGRQVGGYAGVVFTARRIDPATGTVIGQPFELLRHAVGPIVSTTALRYSREVSLPANGAYEVCGQNIYPEATGFAQENKAYWDELTAFKNDVRIRPKTTEIVMRVRAGAGLAVTAFSNVTVSATRILPVWNGAAWVEQPTRKAVWALCDLVRAAYGLDDPDGYDVAKALAYAGRLTKNDTYDGVLPEVSSYWEAASQVALVMRADPVKIGAVHSFVRDEPSSAPRHVLGRRQIVRDSGSASFHLYGEGGDVIVEFDRDGDPAKPDEVRYSYGAPSRTPKRYRVAGISAGAHALEHATWLALVSVFRTASRTVTTEWDGRLIYPGDAILSDLWYLKGKTVAGVAAAAGTLLTLDCDAGLPATWGYGSIRSRAGREWGILQMRGVGARGLELDAADVAALTVRTGLGLADVLARDGQDPTTVVLGELVELQETYVCQAALPADRDHVRVEMLADDPRVWQLLGEASTAPAPVGTDPLAEPLLPRISVLHAVCRRIETGIEVAWSLTPARGARAYAVWLSYDGGATREPLSNGPAVAGRAAMRQSDGAVTVIAVAYGATGLHGDEIATTFTTVAPAIAGNLVDTSTLAPIAYAGLAPAVQAQIDRLDGIQAQATAAAQAAQDVLAKAEARLDELKRGLSYDPAVRQGHIDAKVGDLRGDIARLTDIAARNMLDLAQLRDTMAAAGIEVLSGEGRVRISAVSELASSVGQQITSLSVTVDALKGQIELYGSVQGGNLDGLVSSINATQVKLDAVTATVSTLATSAQFGDLTARLATAEQTLSAQGALIATRASQATVDAQGTRLTFAENRISAAEGRISDVVTATSSTAADGKMVPRLLGQFSDLLGQQLGAMASDMARAETATAAAFDEAGRATAELSGRLLAYQGDAAAQFITSTRAIADVSQALVETQTFYGAVIAGVQASLTTEISARANADTAQTARTDGALSRIGTAEAGLTSLGKTVADNAAATTQQLTGAVSRIGAAEAGLTSLGQTVATNQSSTATQFQGVSTRFGQVEGRADALEGRATAVEGRTARSEADISTILTAYAAGDAALSHRLDAYLARLGNAEAATAAEVTNRVNADGALSSRLDQVSARTDQTSAGVASLQQAQASSNSAQASVNTDLYARNDRGTAFGRFGMSTVAAPNGVSVRLAAVASVDSYGGQRNAGWYIDLLPDGTSREVHDVNTFALTADGGVTFPFIVSGGVTRIRNLIVDGTAIIPGSLNQSDAGFAPNDTSVSFTITVPTGTRVAIWASSDGKPSTPRFISDGAGILRIARDGNAIRDRGVQFYVAQNRNGDSFLYTLNSESFYRDAPPAGTHTYTISVTNGQKGVSFCYFATNA